MVERQQIADILGRIKKRKDEMDVWGRLKWIRLKTLSIYLRYVVILQQGVVLILCNNCWSYIILLLLSQ